MIVNFRQEKDDIIKEDVLIDVNEYYNKLKLIEDSSISDEMKDILKLAATRFIKFRYDQFAKEYYLADEETKKLFIELCLVILDKDDAIKAGYTNLSRYITENINLF